MDITKVSQHQIDTWADEEARSQAFNEKAEKLFTVYLDNALAFLSNVKFDGKDPDEKLMRSLEDYIDIPEQHAYDFRQTVVVKWVAVLRLTGIAPRWDADWPMKDAITAAIRAVDAANAPSTIKVLKPLQCSCSINTLMASGCKCGYLEKK